MTVTSEKQPAPSTRPILVATVIGVLAVFAFQALGTRTLGAEAYAPIGQLWTVYFLGFTMFLLPIEQVVTQRLALAGGDLSVLRPLRKAIVGTVVASMVVTGVFVAATLDRNFGGVTWYLPASVALAGLYVGFALTRGITAGQLRLRDYGVAVATEAVVRLVVAAVLLAIWPTAASLVVAMIVAAFAGLAGRPWVGEASGVSRPSAREARQLTGLVVGTVASQAMLASGPIVVAFLDGSAREVSVVFVSFVLLRGPLTSAYNFLSRILHWFTIEIQQGRTAEVRHRIRSGVAVTVAGAVAAATGAALLGPDIVAGIYGSDFRPTALLMATGAVGVVLASGALFLGLVLIATEHARSIALAWTIALVVMIAGVALIGGDPGQRFAYGFVIGEVAALALIAQRVFHHTRPVPTGQQA